MSRQSARLRRRKAFTLVELLIVIGIIVILIAIIMPATQLVRQSARSNACAHNLTQLGDAYIRAMRIGNDRAFEIAASRIEEPSFDPASEITYIQLMVVGIVLTSLAVAWWLFA